MLMQSGGIEYGSDDYDDDNDNNANPRLWDSTSVFLSFERFDRTDYLNICIQNLIFIRSVGFTTYVHFHRLGFIDSLDQF